MRLDLSCLSPGRDQGWLPAKIPDKLLTGEVCPTGYIAPILFLQISLLISFDQVSYEALSVLALYAMIAISIMGLIGCVKIELPEDPGKLAQDAFSI